MSLSVADVQAALTDWPRTPFPSEPRDDGIGERLRQILFAGGDPQANQLPAAELAPLMRQYLLRESWRVGSEIRLRVPASSVWPSVSDWTRHGIKAFAVGGDFVLSAVPWHPTWLENDDRGVFEEAFTEQNVRTEGRCEADPFIAEATGYAFYSCPGQREAIRAAFLMRPGDTLIVNLPTGSGKSLVGHAPALVNRQDGALTLFVVPTVALAIDQARQMGTYLKRNNSRLWPLAWHGGTSPEERAEIRQRLQSGTQRILFTSPEAVTTSLLRTVVETAQAGMLRYLVIDEAHLVAQWGDEFRPAFQALAGLRNGLLRQAPHGGFRTLLLSATFTAETVEILADLFGPPEHVQAVSAVHLRPEPQYWFHHASSKKEKRERVLEALRYAPRPFILYVTRRQDAREWLSTLRDEVGLRRIACFEGETGQSDRQKIIEDWVCNRLDGIVATSAFGVGIDKNDVRTIIHATIPETLDRYYQEVGRGGRDGFSSISLLVFDDTDWALPERLAAPKIISDELGIDRWRALHDSKGNEDHDGLVQINLDAVPRHLTGGSDYNASWNMRTLLLMCRAGLIALDIDNSNEIFGIADEFSPSSPLAAMARVRVRILDHGHLLAGVWESRVGPARSRTYQAAVRNLRLMKLLLVGEREVGETLAELYRIRLAPWPVDVTRVCGGCPSDRKTKTAPASYHVPCAAPIIRISDSDGSRWFQYFPWLDPTLLYVTYEGNIDAPSVQHSIVRFVGWLISECGVRELATGFGTGLKTSLAWHRLYRQSLDGVVLYRSLGQFDEEPYSPLARVSVFDGEARGDLLERTCRIQRPVHIVLIPIATPDPINHNRLLMQTATNGAKLAQLLETLSQ